MLSASNDELLDLAASGDELLLSGSGAPTGVRLIKLLGAGGMSTVFLAELDASRRSSDLAVDAPARLAIKMTQPQAMQALKTYNIDHHEIIRRETVSLSRVMAHKPPTEFVIGFYGGAQSDVVVRGTVMQLPWMALEYVDGGAAGTSLFSRVTSSRDGIDPPRALRFARGIIDGVRTLHAVGAIHRDLKPDNVLVAGPIDDETPKVADCGIARVAGVDSATFNACTIEYAGIEQLRAVPGEHNPLVGPWTDVHALAGVIWFILAGESWCRGGNDTRFLLQGERRSLRTGQRLHHGFLSDSALLDRLDAVVARGGAARLPVEADTAAENRAGSKAAQLYTAIAPTLPQTRRYPSVDAFAAELFPLLEAAEARWKERAAGENRAATAFRPTMMVQAMQGGALARVVERSPQPIKGTSSQFGVNVEPLDGHSLVFHSDGKVLAKFGSKLIYFVEGQPHRVAVPADLEPALARSRWLARGAGGGFAVVGAKDLVLVRGGRLWAADLPNRATAVGDVQAVFSDGRVLGIVTAGTEETDEAPEFWQTSDGKTWSSPSELAIRGDIRSIASGPFGFFAVGASSNGKSARAVHLAFNGQVTIPKVKDLPPLDLVVCGAGREAWAAGVGVLVRLERDAAIGEPCAMTGAPTALALDLVGQPWLVTDRAVYRRHVDGAEPSWKRYYVRESPEGTTSPALVGIGFTPAGAHVYDAAAGVVDIEPHDVSTWRQPER